MMQKHFKDLHFVHLDWKGCELFEIITVKMQPQTESCFTHTIFIENENSVKNIFVGIKRKTEYKTREVVGCSSSYTLSNVSITDEIENVGKEMAVLY
jgi:hypothetical protein